MLLCDWVVHFCRVVASLLLVDVLKRLQLDAPTRILRHRMLRSVHHWLDATDGARDLVMDRFLEIRGTLRSEESLFWIAGAIGSALGADWSIFDAASERYHG